MPRDSALDDSLFGDALVGVVDDVRRAVHDALGTRPWKVSIVKRTWSGGAVGVGLARVSILELDPNPLVERVTEDRMGPAGREAAGNVRLSEVSLAYSEADVAPEGSEGAEYAYLLEDLRGTRLKPRWFVLAASPIPRRGDRPSDSVDWYILLKETANMGLLDSTEAS